MLFRLLFGLGQSIAYTVHTPPSPALDRLEHAEQLIFIKDGFTPSAFLLGPVWLAAHGIWWAVVAYAGLAAIGLGTVYMLGLPFAVAVATLVALHVLIGFEADELHRGSLEQQGWQTVGSVTGQDALDCERRFLETWLPATAVRVGGARGRNDLSARVPEAGRLGQDALARGMRGWWPKRD